MPYASWPPVTAHVYILGDVDVDLRNSISLVTDFHDFSSCYVIHCLIHKPTRVTDNSSTSLQ